MRQTMRWLVAGGLVAVLLSTGCRRSDDWDLQILTPHSDEIQQEFDRAFQEHVGRPLKIRWIKRGTREILQQLDAQERQRPGDTFGMDVFFGGGVPDHGLAASRGYLERANIPDTILAGIPADIAGVANYDESRLWYGSALSSFGVLVNLRGLRNQNLPPVEVWSDLADPRMFRWVVVADPQKSSSVAVSYELVLQQHGWDDGWPLLMQMFANARIITDSSARIPNEIATGEVLAGPCIDFYAWGRIAEAGRDVLAYVHPRGGSAITPDPIALLRKAPHRELAEQFITFVLSPEGQRLWVLPAGTEGGPKQNTLRRLPVRPDVCEQNAEALVVRDPYQEAAAGVFGKIDDQVQRQRSALLAVLIGAAFVDQHNDLQTAWKALMDGGMKPAALAEWRRLPFTADETPVLAEKLQGGGSASDLKLEWSRWFREKYQRVRELSR